MKNMLKKLLLGSMCLCLFTGCGNKDVDLDLDKIKEDLSNLAMDTVSIPSISSNISEYFANAESIYDHDFDEKFGLNKEDIESYAVAIDDHTKDMYFILKPIDGKKETVKETMNAYFENLLSSLTDEESKNKVENRKEEEYQGILIYLVSDQNEQVMTAIKNSKDPVFGMMMYIDQDALNQNFNINSEDLEEYLIATPMMIVNSNTYIIVKPKANKKETVKKAIDKYMTDLETQWSTYLPDQYELVQNRLVKEYGGYLIYIVSSDNEKVYNTIVK